MLFISVSIGQTNRNRGPSAILHIICIKTKQNINMKPKTKRKEKKNNTQQQQQLVHIELIYLQYIAVEMET